MQLKGGLYHYTQIKFAFNSNRIEGNRLSEDQARYIYETNTFHTEKEEAADVDDIIETVNHFFLFRRQRKGRSHDSIQGMLKE